jgi:hypothetical protein
VGKDGRLEGIQLLSLIFAFGHTLGVVASNKIKFLMLALNTVLIIGQVNELKYLFQNHDSKL